MKPLIIVGAGDLAKMLYYYVTEYDNRTVAAFSVEREYLASCGGLPDHKEVVPFEDLREPFSPEEYDILMGIGYSHMNQVKAKIFEKCKKVGYHVASFIHPEAHISANAILGMGNIILEGVTIASSCKIGSGNFIWNGVNISHDSNIGNFNNLAPSFCCAGRVRIGSYCFLGTNSTIKNDISVSDFTLVGAGAYVSHDTNPYDVIVPARSITLEGKKSIDFL